MTSRAADPKSEVAFLLVKAKDTLMSPGCQVRHSAARIGEIAFGNNRAGLSETKSIFHPPSTRAEGSSRSHDNSCTAHVLHLLGQRTLPMEFS
ncbi:hypothetical protein NPIL_136381 [Nephila pilipes]|uniref:Uncharacterized protein n=1 Tax=Nephila pilipes TaxID=299642 RepID=A0A8X6UIL2_NEPPI|nr:hypothetical protein NPIL_136381 [Nephila pilipes]